MVAVVGGGQLARMMAPAAAELGVTLRVLVEGAGASAGQVVVDAPHGASADAAAVSAVALGDAERRPADVLTFEHEHVPHALLHQVSDAGVPVRPGPHALEAAQDKIVMRRRLTELGVACPAWAALPRDPEAARAALDAFVAAHGGAAVVKTARGGYDGKGVRVVRGSADVGEWIASAALDGPALLVEEKVPFVRELAAVVARRPSGEVAAYPVVESVQRDGVCAEVLAPAPGLDPALAAHAQAVAEQIATALDLTGVLAVELFEVDGAVLVNELAMRPHNSGHWTITGAVTSQFAQHLRAVLDLPLGSTSPVARWTVMVNVLGSRLTALTDALPDVLADPAVQVNLYGKEIRPGRKLGHVTVSGSDLAEVRARANRAAALLRGEDADDGVAAPTADATRRNA
ncbi:N5-carboxyaminoimidazole ribonucleotide synthase [Flavimobilis marinus]|uniref:N5-carboxyaminoimidazole ribonucleotide synthase n=1 Tax=Flavimobilis marinus TaxID=285351 RepID=A0A1I2HG35_9MICO|nr:N5-carboxyaminoimidazole ribonucleotide synthase [Flavimobilis marinus]SFF28363.1 5-(carboxyamino)imidazole ribonucleotide synthase [Flavimobilis marinus]